MSRTAGAKNRTKVELTMSPWYAEKIKELRVGTGFETDQGFAKWLLQNTVQILTGEREPKSQHLSDLRLRIEQALPNTQEGAVNE